jgi:aminopeptidase
MNDPRLALLAEKIVSYSTRLQPGDKVLIDAFDVPSQVPIALIRAARAAGATPFVQIHQAQVSRELALEASPALYETAARHALAFMQDMDAYIAIRGANNITEQADVPPDKVELVARLTRPVTDHRVNKTRWCVLRWPTSAMAQQAGTSTEAFEDFFFRVCLIDYAALLPAMDRLKSRFDAASEVHITGPGTDLRFSLEGLQAIACGGAHNIPDGEVFSAPVKDSVQGTLRYNAPTVYQGTAFDDVTLTFKDGKIVDATSSNTRRLNEILDSDEGARYIGEFAIGFNPEIMKPMRDILFDEKIAGSFHFTPGQAYQGITDNGNRSQVHWDLVCIQRPEYGGGEIYFDGELLRKDGLFIPEDLHPLNP